MIRTKILLLTLLATAILAAALGIVQMWWEPIPEETFFKTLITLVIVGALASFLTAVDYDMPGSRGRIMLGLLVVLALGGCGLCIAQLWWEALPIDIFIKLLITIAVLAGLFSFIMVAREDLGSNKKLRNEKYID